MKSQAVAIVALVAIWCGSCSSPSAPSVETLYELRIAESPSCAGMATRPPNFFTFGVVTVHVKGSFSEGMFLLVDDSLAVFGAQCNNNARPALRLVDSSPASTVSGRLDGGVWSAVACVGGYVGAQGTVSGTRQATSASGLLNGSLVSGVFALNVAGSCTATDHTWSLKPVGAQP